MTSLITGCTGLIGSRIARDLIKEGEEVVAYDLFPDLDLMRMLLTDEEMALLKVVDGDVSDLDRLMRTVTDNNVDIIFHMASLLGKAITDDICRAAKVNGEGTINIFETARRLTVKKVIWASTNAVFSGQNDESYIPDDHPHRPWGLYGAFKSLGENVADFYFNEYGVDITAPRYGAMIYGAGQQRGNSASIMRELILKPALGDPGRVPWGDDTLAWLYVDDAARAAVLASKKPRIKTGAYNVGGEILTVKEASTFVKKLIPDAHIELLPGYLNGPPWNLDTTSIEQEIGYFPLWTTKEGIRESINMIRRQSGLQPV